MVDRRDQSPLSLEYFSNYGIGKRGRIDNSFFVKSRWRGYLQVLGNIACFISALTLASEVTVLWQGFAVFFAIGSLQHRLFFPSMTACIFLSIPVSLKTFWSGQSLRHLSRQRLMLSESNI